MSFFSGAGLPAGLASFSRPAAAKPDVAADTQRLLNSYTQHMLALESETATVKSKQEAAQGAYAEAVRALAEAKNLLLRAEGEAATLASESAARENELRAKSSLNARLTEEVRTAQTQVDHTHALADAQRASFMQQCEKLQRELVELHAAYPHAFLTTKP